MIKKVLAALALILSIFVVVAALKPADYLIKRDILINAKPEAIFPYLSSAKNADSWMPWADHDPQVKNSYSGPDDGVGSTASWESPGQMGTGKAEVVAIVPLQSVKTKITYSKPMEMNQDSEFILTPEGENTRMTWQVGGNQPFIARFMCTIMFMNMDKYVGGMFEEGLNKLKTKVEMK